MRRKDLNLSRGNASFGANFPPDRGCFAYQTWLVRVESAYDSNHASRKRRDEIRFIREASTQRRNGCPRKEEFRNKRLSILIELIKSVNYVSFHQLPSFNHLYEI